MKPYNRFLAEEADISDVLLRCNPEEVIALAMLAGAEFTGNQGYWQAHPLSMGRMTLERAAADYLIGCDIPLPERVTP